MIETKNMGKIKNESVFWNEKARNFPIYDETDTEDMRAIHSIMDIAASRGVSIEHKNIIDRMRYRAALAYARKKSQKRNRDGCIVSDDRCA